MKKLIIIAFIAIFFTASGQEYARILSYTTKSESGNSLLTKSSTTTLKLLSMENHVQITGLLRANHPLYKKINLKKGDTLQIVYYQDYNLPESTDKTDESGVSYEKHKKLGILKIDVNKFEPEHYKEKVQIGYHFKNVKYPLNLPEPKQEIIKTQ